MKFTKLAALLLAAAFLFCACATADLPETEGTTEDPTISLDAYGSNTATALDDYAVLVAAPDDSNMSAIVAINAAGDPLLSNSQLNVWYWLEFYSFLNSYGSYISYFGLDVTTPLAEQSSLTENYSWEQYFLEAAASRFQQYYAIACLAEENGFTLSEDEEAQIADIIDPDGEFAAEAYENGLESNDAYVQMNFGQGADAQSYMEYLRIYYLAYSYCMELQDSYTASVSEDDVVAYYDENVGDDTAKVNNIKVRHILIQPEEMNEDGTDYTDEAWAAAQQEADNLYQLWLSNPTEEYFAELAEEHTADGGSQSTGGLYEDVAPGEMVDEFNDWCFDAARVVGDSAIVKTTYGYHIMYFSGVSETRAWYDDALEDMVNAYLDEVISDAIERYPTLFDYTQVRLYDLVTEAANDDTDETAVG